MKNRLCLLALFSIPLLCPCCPLQAREYPDYYTLGAYLPEERSSGLHFSWGQNTIHDAIIIPAPLRLDTHYSQSSLTADIPGGHYDSDLLLFSLQILEFGFRPMISPKLLLTIRGNVGADLAGVRVANPQTDEAVSHFYAGWGWGAFLDLGYRIGSQTYLGPEIGYRHHYLYSVYGQQKDSLPDPDDLSELGGMIFSLKLTLMR